MQTSYYKYTFVSNVFIKTNIIMSEKKLLFELHGFKVMSDSIYLVTDRPDYDAPSGFQDAGVTKLPSDGVGVTFQCPYKATSKTTGIWDSGFWDMSPCYANKKDSEVSIIVKGLEENVVRPYRRAIGNPEALSNQNPEFFEQTSWRVEEGKVFRTSDPKDVVALYMALLAREVVPKDKKGDSSFADAAYYIIDINEKMKKRDERASNMFEAIGIFEGLFEKDKTKLDRMLFYLGKTMAEDTSKAAYRGMFKDYLESSPVNIESFNKLFNESEKQTGRDKLEIYYALKSKEIVNPKLEKAGSGVLFYDGIEIGPDLKTAADNISKNPDLIEIKKEILLGFDDEE